jgi:2-polyprenyl-3-methyl-5-hydroxy-6-metoxy-1,4-benzoquinol methylase
MELNTPMQKGLVHPAYTGARDDVTSLVPARALRVLDVGCSVGAVGEALGRRGHTVTGIESDPELAARARTCLGRVIEADVEALAVAGEAAGGPYDCVIFADVLEHLRDPWAVTRWAAGFLSDLGCFVISVPNIRHAHLVRSVLIHRHWPYEDVGIFDRTHLRSFAFHNLPELLEGTGLHITELRRSYALNLNPAARINRLAPYIGDFGTLQFIFRAEAEGERAT